MYLLHSNHPCVLTETYILNPQVMVLDDAFRISTLTLGHSDGLPTPPEVVNQHTVKGKTGDVWTGLVETSACVAPPVIR